MLQWEVLLSVARRRELDGDRNKLGTSAGRTEFERDYDRILFATPTRRLADKTQVFPMDDHDSVRSRLTHSHEVSNLARSIGVSLAFEHAEQVFGKEHERLNVKRNIPAVLAAVGLAHDLGNPPFGHQGEVAIQEWFKVLAKSEPIDDDFTDFDGNAQTFRLLTRLQLMSDQYGLNLTVGTLAALTKYPSIYGSADKGGFKKYGIFKGETKVIQQVWEHTGLRHGVRHPLAYVMEACDDIAYSVIDAEDTVKKGYASFYDLIDYLETHGGEDGVIEKIIEDARKQNKKFKAMSLSSRELNDKSMQMFRVLALSVMVQAATTVFVENIDKIMNGSVPSGFELMQSSKCARLTSTLKSFDMRHGFQHKDVLKLELQGNHYIKGMMTMLWRAISVDSDKRGPFERYVYGVISENYRAVYDSTPKKLADRCYLLCDVISGMTERHLIKKHDEFRSLLDAPPRN